MVAGPAQGRPGVASACGKLRVLQVSPQADELGPHRAALEIERPAFPQPENACLESLPGEEGRGPRPQTGCGRIHSAEQAAGHVEKFTWVALPSSQRSPCNHAASLLARRTRSTAATAWTS